MQIIPQPLPKLPPFFIYSINARLNDVSFGSLFISLNSSVLKIRQPSSNFSCSIVSKISKREAKSVMFLLTLKRDLYFGYNSHDSQKKKNLPSYFNVKNSVAAF